MTDKLNDDDRRRPLLVTDEQGDRLYNLARLADALSKLGEERKWKDEHAPSTARRWTVVGSIALVLINIGVEVLKWLYRRP